MLAAVGCVDVVYGVYHLDDVLDRNCLVGPEHYACVVDVGADAGAQEGFQFADSDGYIVVDEEVVVFVDINGDVFAGHGLAVAFGQ